MTTTNFTTTKDVSTKIHHHEITSTKDATTNLKYENAHISKRKKAQDSPLMDHPGLFFFGDSIITYKHAHI